MGARPAEVFEHLERLERFAIPAKQSRLVFLLGKYRKKLEREAQRRDPKASAIVHQWHEWFDPRFAAAEDVAKHGCTSLNRVCALLKVTGNDRVVLFSEGDLDGAQLSFAEALERVEAAQPHSALFSFEPGRKLYCWDAVHGDGRCAFSRAD